MKKPFHETIWAKVEVGDTVLRPWKPLDQIVEVQIEMIEPWQGLDGKQLLRAKYLFAGERYSRVFDPEETIYVQSRL
jgi:hypothetical protein